MKVFTGFYRFFWLFTAPMICFTSCSEDIPMIHPGTPQPVVYGVFDLSQSVHYIKLSKTFAGETDPYTLAHDRDQIFYTNAKVYLTEGSGSHQIPFHLITDIPRAEGSFPALPNELFVLNQKLYADEYHLTIILPDEHDTLTADFTFLNSFKVVLPKAGFKRFYFYEDPLLFSWNSDPAAGLYEIALNLTYEEWLKNGESRVCTDKYTRQVTLAELIPESNRYNYLFYSDSYFAHLGTSIRLDNTVDFRKPVNLEMLITACDTTLSRYLDWFDLEIDDKVNPNGNVSGAIGVVATKFSVPFNDLVLSPRSQDSLVKGRYTKKLDFVNNPNW